jgi:hypothetical protein
VAVRFWQDCDLQSTKMINRGIVFFI